jgi:hypothetical protein
MGMGRDVTHAMGRDVTQATGRDVTRVMGWEGRDEECGMMEVVTNHAAGLRLGRGAWRARTAPPIAPGPPPRRTPRRDSESSERGLDFRRRLRRTRMPFTFLLDSERRRACPPGPLTQTAADTARGDLVSGDSDGVTEMPFLQSLPNKKISKKA